MYFTKEVISYAAEKAKKVIEERKALLEGYVRGLNDCWALIVQYDKHLRGGSTPLEELNLSYKDYKEFIKQINKVGYNDFEDLARNMKYERVTDGIPQHGDIGYEMAPDGTGTAILCDNNWWYTASERGINQYRRTRILERRPVYHGRPLRI